MSNPIVGELIELLKLERLEENLFRGQSRDIGTRYVFGGQVLGRALQDAFELHLRLFELLQLDQRASESDPRRKIPGVNGQAGTADVHGLLKLAGAAVFLGQLRERDRRRVLLDPSSQIFQS